MKPRLNIALCGLGYYAQNLLAPGIEESQFCDLKGIITGNREKAREWKMRYGLKDQNIYDYENFDEIIHNPEIDLVYIVLPNSMHKEFVFRSARAGKHIITEKPMGVGVEECEEMIQVCRENQVQLGLGYRLHFEPHNLEIIRMAREKVWGEVRLIESEFSFKVENPFQWRFQNKMAGGGPLMDIGIYCIQASRYVLGLEPLSVRAQFGPISRKDFFYEIEESIFWEFEFPYGILSRSHCSYSTNREFFKATTDQGFFELSPAFSYGPIHGRTHKSFIEFPHINHQAAQMDGIAPFILEGKELPDHIRGEEGLRDMKLIQAIYTSARLGTKIIL